ncbi:MAG: hypothetical protein JXJ04_10940 [Spirochaetales bacterium]|nr:hypothetical protein [Spirochaetales bacterium]
MQQSLDRWFHKQENMSTYISLKQDLYNLFTYADSLSLPLSLLFERLQEGFSKHVPPERLLKALNDEVERLFEIVTMIKEIDTLSYSQRKVYFFSNQGFDHQQKDKTEMQNFTNLVYQLSIFNRSGISVMSMSELFTLAIKTERSKEIILSVLHGLIKIPGLDNLDDQEMADLGRALTVSTLSPESYGTLSSIFVKGRIYHLNYPTISNIIITELNRGGGIIQIEQEIIRRGRKR